MRDVAPAEVAPAAADAAPAVAAVPAPIDAAPADTAPATTEVAAADTAAAAPDGEDLVDAETMAEQLQPWLFCNRYGNRNLCIYLVTQKDAVRVFVCLLLALRRRKTYTTC